jgi:hypothetical protein
VVLGGVLRGELGGNILLGLDLLLLLGVLWLVLGADHCWWRELLLAGGAALLVVDWGILIFNRLLNKHILGRVLGP